MTASPPRSAAELARERRLRDDPMADVHGPSFVSCKRCGNRIKLSPKSSYDPFHWMRHRERCLRKPLVVARAAQKYIHTSPPKQSSASSSNTDATPPPLTPDDDRPVVSDVFRDRSRSPDLDLPAHPLQFPSVERWQTWNWSELRHPPWITDEHFASALGNDVDYGDDDVSLSSVHVSARARSQDAPSLPA